MRRGSLVLTVLLGALVAFPATALATTTFGANLSREPDNTRTCITIQVFPLYGPTCSAESIDPVTAESSFPPAGDGVVSRVRVRVGPTTGPMQIVEEEALRQDNPADPGHPTYACCKAVALSAVFTPAANSTTTVPVNFHVKQDLAPEASGYYVDDHLSLSVLDPNVPIPAATDPNASDGYWFPAWQSAGEERAGIYGDAGYTILFNADWDAGNGGGGGGGGGQPVTLANKTARVRNGNALVNLLCTLAVPCAGQLRLQNRQARVAMLLAPRKGLPTTYSSVKFKIPAGKKKAIKAPLNAAGKRLLKHRKKAKVWATISPAGGGVAPPPTQVTLKK